MKLGGNIDGGDVRENKREGFRVEFIKIHVIPV